MFVTVGEQKYRVQFVHAARDLKTSRASENPGGLRQFVDNLAKSLRRRVTLAEVARVETIPTGDATVPEAVSYVPLGQGFAICHHTDHFVKRDGRGRALLRALKATQLPADVKSAIARAAGFANYETLKLLYAGHAPVVLEDVSNGYTMQEVIQ